MFKIFKPRSCLQIGDKYISRVVQFAGDLVKKLTSVILMLVFTAFAFVVLVVSVIFLTTQSIISTIFSQAKAPTKESLQELPQGESLSSNHLSQTK
jgi:hypothetical protein